MIKFLKRGEKMGNEIREVIEQLLINMDVPSYVDTKDWIFEVEFNNKEEALICLKRIQEIAPTAKMEDTIHADNRCSVDFIIDITNLTTQNAIDIVLVVEPK